MANRIDVRCGGQDCRINPAIPPGDATCPHCGYLMWFDDETGEPIAKLRTMLLRLITQRFGPVGDHVRVSIQEANPDELDRWFHRALEANTLNEVFRWNQPIYSQTAPEPGFAINRQMILGSVIGLYVLLAFAFWPADKPLDMLLIGLFLIGSIAVILGSYFRQVQTEDL